MAFSAKGIAAELAPLESTDPVVKKVANNIRSIIKDLGANQQIPALQIYFPEFTNVDPGVAKPVYYTEGCLSILPSTVVVNARFLRETEAGIRSFGLCDTLLNTPYLRNDACMFGLVKRVREEGGGWLEKLRKFEDGKKSTERNAVDELTMTTLFFCAHEIGHLNDGVNAAQYAAFLDKSKQFETRLANAAVKLRRHASEFEEYGFGLPGWQDVIKSEHEAFAAAEKLRGPIAAEDEENADWFQKEISADAAAVELMVRHLKDRPLKYRWLLVRGLFAAAMYAWYKDLLLFCERMNVPRQGTAPMLSFELMREPKTYIRAASLFGDIHRSTMLRATLGIQEILKADQDQKSETSASAPVHETFLARATALWSKVVGGNDGGDDKLERHWRWESAQHHLLLAIHMDTIVKLAYVGASMPFRIEKEAARGSPQLMMVQFEAIDQSVARLKKMIGNN